ncbi:MAG: zf-HC2 domain-containing protein [Gemmatimonadales bacterium]
MAESLDCRKAMAHLHDYLKREITPETAAGLREHLERCRPCFSHARFEENFLRMLESCARRETCPDGLRERILASLRAETGDT